MWGTSPSYLNGPDKQRDKHTDTQGENIITSLSRVTIMPREPFSHVQWLKGKEPNAFE